MRMRCLAFVALCLLGTGGAAHAEAYVALMAGNGQVSDSTVTVTQTQLFCFTPPCSQTVANRVHFDRQHAGGIRLGVWFEYLGLAAEYTTSGVNNSSTPVTSPNVSGVEVNYDATTALVMVRTPTLRTAYLPDSYLYAGVGASTVYGRFSVITQQLVPTSGDVTTSSTLFLVGGAMHFSRVMLFAEWRARELSLHSDYLGASADIPLSSTELLGGLAYQWE
jgi:hypothetical protein